jgi:RNA recognition motif-containing protein
MNVKLYVGNLAFGASEEDMKKLFSEAGAVQSVKIVTDSYSGRSRGFGFVEMTFMDRALIVSEARPQKKKGGEFQGRRDRNR